MYKFQQNNMLDRKMYFFSPKRFHDNNGGNTKRRVAKKGTPFLYGAQTDTPF